MNKLSQARVKAIFELDKEIIGIEEHSGTFYPVLRTYDDGRNLRFWCIHCGIWHSHGRGGLDEPYQEGRGGFGGHRSHHCTSMNSPYNQTGVILDVIGRSNEIIRKNYRKGRTYYCRKCRKHYSTALNACSCGFANNYKPVHPDIANLYQTYLKEES